MTLGINVTTASQELADSHINQAIISLASLVAKKNRAGLVPVDSPFLEITFMLPGKLDKPDFSGMRMGGYTSQSNTLFFEKAVPEHILHSPQSTEYVVAVVQDVVNNACEFFKNTNAEFNDFAWQRFARQIGQELGTL